jgi:hypothetical protein
MPFTTLGHTKQPVIVDEKEVNRFVDQLAINNLIGGDYEPISY